MTPDPIAPVDDRRIVAALRGNPSVGMAAMYDRYADRLFDYATGVLRDRHRAADVVHDTLLIAAERVGQLRDPDRLRPWLYAITRRECLRAHRDSARHGDLDDVGQLPDDHVDLGAELRADELRELVWTAVGGLSPVDREVLELTLRHGLDNAALADVQGISPKQASVVAARARANFEHSLGVLVVARTGRATCPELADMLRPWDGEFNPLWRKRIARHVESCAQCGSTRRRDASAAALLGLAPFLVAPLALRVRVGKSSGAAGLAPGTAYAATEASVAEVSVLDPARPARRAGPWDRSGFPVTGRALRRSAVVSAAVVVAAMTLGFTVAGGVFAPSARPPVLDDLSPSTTVAAPTDYPTDLPTDQPPPLERTPAAPTDQPTATDGPTDEPNTPTQADDPVAAVDPTPEPVPDRVPSAVRADPGPYPDPPNLHHPRLRRPRTWDPPPRFEPPARQGPCRTWSCEPRSGGWTSEAGKPEGPAQPMGFARALGR